VTATGVGRDGRQTRPDAVGADASGADRSRDLAARRAGAGVPLVFGDGRDEGRHLGRLGAGRLGVGGRRRRGQRRVAAVAVGGAEGDDPIDAVGWQQALQVGRLTAPTTFGLLLGDGLGRRGDLRTAARRSCCYWCRGVLRVA
jgi:hypothetical protein